VVEGFGDDDAGCVMEEELVVGWAVDAEFEDVGCGCGIRDLVLRSLGR